MMACILTREPSTFSHLQPYFAETRYRYELLNHMSYLRYRQRRACFMVLLSLTTLYRSGDSKSACETDPASPVDVFDRIPVPIL